MSDHDKTVFVDTRYAKADRKHKTVSASIDAVGLMLNKSENPFACPRIPEAIRIGCFMDGSGIPGAFRRINTNADNYLLAIYWRDESDILSCLDNDKMLCGEVEQAVDVNRP